MAITKLNDLALGATTFDKVQQNINITALASAISNNRAAFDLPNAFIEQFENSTFVDSGSTSQVAVDANEKINTDTTTNTQVNCFNDFGTWGGNSGSIGTGGFTVNGSTNTRYTSGAGGAGGYLYSPNTTTNLAGLYRFTFKLITDGGSGGYFAFHIRKDGGSDPGGYSINEKNAVPPYHVYSHGATNGQRFRFEWDPANTPNAITGYHDATGDGTFESTSTSLAATGSTWTSSFSNVGWFIQAWRNSGDHWVVDLEEGLYITTAFYTSGTLFSTAQTVTSSVSQMGVALLYENNNGTNTLNTDIIVSVSADNGSNYTPLTLESRGAFDASGLQLAIAPKKAVTAGTQLKYKIQFANQSSGSKKASIKGISLVY